MTRPHTAPICLLATALAVAPSLIAQEDSSPRTQALALEKKGLTTEAEQIWDGMAKANPQDAEALAHLGLLEARQEHYDAAIDYYHRAVAITPDAPGVQLNLGLALFKAAQFPNAMRIFLAEIKKNPGDPRLIILLGMAHYGMKDYLVAIPYLKRATEQDAQNVPLRLTLARSCLASKQYPCVLDAHREIQALHAESAEADILAAEALDQLRDRAGAEKQVRAALQLNPNAPNAHFALGYILWSEGKWAAAAAEFQQELQNDTHEKAQEYLADSQQHLRQESASTAPPPSSASLQEMLDAIENPAP